MAVAGSLSVAINTRGRGGAVMLHKLIYEVLQKRQGGGGVQVAGEQSDL